PEGLLEERVPSLAARALPMPLGQLQATLSAVVGRSSRHPCTLRPCPDGLAATLVEQDVAPAPILHLPHSRTHAHQPKATALVQGDRGGVLGEDAGLERPEPGALGGFDEL